MAVLRIPTATRNAVVDAVTALVGSTGTLKIYSGSQPASANDAASGTLLATVTMGAWAAASAGTAAGADPASVNASATGTAGWFRAANSGGTTVFDGDVTATGGGGTMTLSSTSLTSGNPVDITSVTVTMPAA